MLTSISHSGSPLSAASSSSPTAAFVPSSARNQGRATFTWQDHPELLAAVESGRIQQFNQVLRNKFPKPSDAPVLLYSAIEAIPDKDISHPDYKILLFACLIQYRVDYSVIIAQKSCSVKLLERLKKAGADLRKTNPKGTSALCAAAISPPDFEAGIEFLIESGVDVNNQERETGFFDTPLHGLVVNEATERALFYIACAARHQKKINACLQDFNGRTPLHLAVITQQTKVVQEILRADRGCVNIPDKFGRTALHYAAMLGSEEIAQMLIQAEATINSIDNEQNTPLHCSALPRSTIESTLKSVCIDPERDAGSCRNSLLINEIYPIRLDQDYAQDLISLGFIPIQTFERPNRREDKETVELLACLHNKDLIEDEPELLNKFSNNLPQQRDFLKKQMSKFVGTALADHCIKGRLAVIKLLEKLSAEQERHAKGLMIFAGLFHQFCKAHVKAADLSVTADKLTSTQQESRRLEQQRLESLADELMEQFRVVP